MEEIKIKVFPNKMQLEIIEKTLFACNWLRTYYINERDKVYKETGKAIGWKSFISKLTQLKKEHEELKGADSKALQWVIASTGKEYEAFFNSIRKTQRGILFPKPKEELLSYTVYTVDKQIELAEHYIKFPKIKYVDCAPHEFVINNKIRGGSVIKEKDGYYITIREDTYTEEEKEAFKKRIEARREWKEKWLNQMEQLGQEAQYG